MENAAPTPTLISAGSGELRFFHYHSWGNGLAQLDSGTTMILSLRVWFKLLTWWKVYDNDQQLIGDGIEIVLLRLLSENLCMAKRGSDKYNVTSAGSGIRKYREKRNRAEVASPPFPSFLKVYIFSLAHPADKLRPWWVIHCPSCPFRVHL